MLLGLSSIGFTGTLSPLSESANLLEKYCILVEHDADHLSLASVHVHRPPGVTLNETPEEFHISIGLR